MADLSHWWGDDLSLTASGDLALSTDIVESDQRIFRRLCTNGSQSGGQVAEYIFEPPYGGSAPWYVGRLITNLTMMAIIRSQMYLEPSVSHDPEPKINVQTNPDGTFTATIQYTAINGQPSLPMVVDLNGS